MPKTGITLVALIITIIILIILAGVTLNITLGENGILRKSKEAVQVYTKAEIIEQIRLDIAAKEMENNGSITDTQLNEILENYGTISEDGTILTTNERGHEIEIAEIWNGEVVQTPLPVIGDYVAYNVTYTDMYTGYEFTQTDGWRILDVGTRNSDGTYTGTKLISTGIPAELYYYRNTIKNFEYDGVTEGYWAGDSTQRENYANTFYASSSNDNENMYAAAGLYYNFRKIIFTQGTTASYNNGCYIKVNGKEEGNLAEDEFIVNGVATEVHNLTLTELNTARRLPETSTTSTTTTDGDTGLFYLRDLVSENSSFGYTTNTAFYYWLASPNVNYAIGLISVYNTGSITGYDASITFGLRPVVSLESNITLKMNGEDGNWTIE